MKEDQLSNFALIYTHRDVETEVGDVDDRFSAKNQ